MLFAIFSQNVTYLSWLFLTDTQNLQHIFKIKIEELMKEMKGKESHWNNEIADWISLNGKK